MNNSIYKKKNAFKTSLPQYGNGGKKFAAGLAGFAKNIPMLGQVIDPLVANTDAVKDNPVAYASGDLVGSTAKTIGMGIVNPMSLASNVPQTIGKGLNVGSAVATEKGNLDTAQGLNTASTALTGLGSQAGQFTSMFGNTGGNIPIEMKNGGSLPKYTNGGYNYSLEGDKQGSNYNVKNPSNTSQFVEPKKKVLSEVEKKLMQQQVVQKDGTITDGLGNIIRTPEQKSTGAIEESVSPIDLIGSGIYSGGAKMLAKGVQNTYKINPFAFKPQEGMMYRGLGKEGFEDAIQSGVFRPKQYPENYLKGKSLIERVNSPKTFNSTFYAPAKKFDVIENYGAKYIAEVPYNEKSFFRRYSGRNDWSYSTPEQIPITEGKILQKDWLMGYKEIPTKENGGTIPKYPNGGYKWHTIKEAEKKLNEKELYNLRTKYKDNYIEDKGDKYAENNKFGFDALGNYIYKTENISPQEGNKVALSIKDESDFIRNPNILTPDIIEPEEKEFGKKIGSEDSYYIKPYKEKYPNLLPNLQPKIPQKYLPKIESEYEEFKDGGSLIKYNLPTHEDGGGAIDANGRLVNPNSQLASAELEKQETLDPKQNYIFSDTLKPMKSKITFADLSKRIDNKYKNKVDDISNSSKERELGRLAQSNEEVRLAKESKNPLKMKNGGNLPKYFEGGFKLPTNTDRFTNRVNQGIFGTTELPLDSTMKYGASTYVEPTLNTTANTATTNQQFTTGDKFQLAGLAPATIYNTIQALRPAEKFSPLTSPLFGSGLNDMNQNVRFNTNPILMNRNVGANQINQGSTSDGVRRANLQSLFRGTNTQLGEMAEREALANAQLKQQLGQAKIGVGAQDVAAQERARGFNIQARQAKQQFGATAASQFGQGLTEFGKASNQGLSNRIGYDVLKNIAPNFTLTEYNNLVKKGMSDAEIIKFIKS